MNNYRCKNIKKLNAGILTLILLLSTFIVLIVLPTSSAEPFSGGNGTAEDPYQITHIEHLWNIRNNLSEYFILMNDLDFETDGSYLNTDHKSGNITGSGWLPIGDWSDRFTGSFDGQNYTISNLFIGRDSSDYVGLFGCTDSGSEITNIGLIDIDITGDNSVGGLAGINGEIISNCYSTGDVTGGGRRTGGLIGHNFGSVSNSYSTADVEGYITTGGLIGHNQDSVSNSYSTGSVTGTSVEVGGLVGFNTQFCTISYCYSTGSVTGIEDIGGLVGISQGIIYKSYATGSVTWTGTGAFESNAGGLLGHNYENGGSVSNCYSTGSVTGNDNVGGLVGKNDDSISNSYSIGGVTGNSDVGGLVGSNSDSVTNSFWNTETSGQASSDGGTGKTTTELKTLSTFSGVGWDIECSNMDLNDDYPHLGWQESNDSYIWLIFLPIENIDTGEKFRSIQAAINDSDTQNGHTIQIDAGTYYETIIINKSINLIGEDKNTTIIDGSQNPIVVSITADHVNFSKFTIQNASNPGFIGTSYGIIATSNHTNINNNVVKNNNASFMTFGIIIGDYHDNTISNNIVYNNSYYADGFGITVGGRNNLISDNICYDDIQNIYLASANNCTVSNNNLYNHSGPASDNSYLRIVTYNYTLGIYCVNSKNINFTNNVLHNASLYVDGDNISYYYHNLLGNTFNGKPIFYATNNSDLTLPDEVGQIILVNYSNFTIENKIFNHGTVCVNLYQSYNITFRNSTVNDSYLGLSYQYTNNSTFSNNTFRNNFLPIQFQSSYNNLIYLNNFIDNLYQGYDDFNNVWYNSETNQGNYWNNYSGSDQNIDGIGDTPYSFDLGGNQDPYPLIYERTIPPAFVWVDDDYDSSTPGWNVDHFNNIQDSIDNLATGGTLYIYNGTYNENLNVTKSMTLYGQDRNTTVIDGGGSGVAVNISADYVNISNFSIKNASVGVYQYCFNHSIIENNIIFSHVTYGINMAGSHYSRFSNNYIFNKGLFLSGSGNNTINSNRINDTNIAIQIEDTSSNNNLIYYNDFINNSIQCLDQGNNFWNVSNSGNYWDDFDEPSEGAYDNNSDGIIDMPYNISAGNNQDLYPLAGPYKQRPYQPTLVSPSDGATSVLTSPSLQVRVTDPNNETMNVSFYTSGGSLIGTDSNVDNGGIASVTWSGRSYSTSYSWYVIVNDSTYLTKSDTWSFTTKSDDSTGGGTPPSLPGPDDGDETDITNPPISDPNGPYNALTYQSIAFDGSGSTDNGTITNYTWNFGDGNTGFGVKPTHTYTTAGLFEVTLTVTDDTDLTDSNTTTANITLDTDGDGWSDKDEEYYGSNETDFDNVPTDTDNDGYPDLDDDDDDNDGIDDWIEEMIGSNPCDSSDIKRIEINNKYYYLSDSNNDSKFDKLYYDGKITNVEINEDGLYTVDIDGDDNWDYIYDPVSDTVVFYSVEKPKDDDLPLIPIIVIIVIISIILIFLILFKLGFIRFEEIEK